MKKFAFALVLVFCFTLMASAELTEPVQLTFAAQEVGTGAYSVSAAIQGAMLKGLPAGSTIDLTTNSPGGVGAPVLIQRGRASLIVGNAGPDLYDATIDHVDAGQSTTTEICLTHEMHFVQLSDETLANLNKMGYAPVTMVPNTWNGQTMEIKTMGSQQNVIVNKNMNEDVAYALTKAICENKEDIAKAVASLSWFDPKTAGKHELNGAPLHPGAIKYYKEMGYEFDE